MPLRHGESLRHQRTGHTVTTLLFTLLRGLIVCVLLLLVAQGPGLGELAAQAYLVVVGVCGALVANATGIGGGVVFVPTFNALEMNPDHIVGTSIAIQCFGMSMGALTYLSRRSIRFLPRLEQGGTSRISSPEIIVIVVVSCLLGFALTTEGGFRPDLPLQVIFKVLSLALLAAMFLTKDIRIFGGRSINRGLDTIALIGIGVVGGAFVGWISIGVGELLAVYLMLRGVRAIEAVGLSVVVTSLSVLLIYGLLPGALAADNDVSLIVATGALLGGVLAPILLEKLGERRVKWFCGFWIMMSAIMM